MSAPPPARPERLMLRFDGEAQATTPVELDERLRSGELARSAEVCSASLTGGAWQAVDQVPALAEALDAPNARFAARLRADARVVLVPLLCVLLIVLALVQRGIGWPGEGEAGLRALYGAAAGQGPTLLAGRWWTMLSAHFVHTPEAPLAHVLGNLTIIAYCGYRVEKAWGWSGALRALLGGAAVSALLVSLFSAVPVVGSSTLAFALWGAQIATGFRQGEAVLPAWRRYYGYGNLLIFVPLYVSGLGAPGVSDWGHLGGLLGGAVATLSGSPAVLAPAAAEARARVAAAAEGLAALGISVLVVMLAGYAPGPLLAWGQRDRLLLPSESAALHLPRGVAEPEAPLPTRSYLELSTGAGAALLVEEWRFRDAEALLAHPALSGLAEPEQAEPLPAPPPLGPGWQVEAHRLPAADTASDDEANAEANAEEKAENTVHDVIVIHQRRRGLRLLRLVERYADQGALPESGASRALRGALEGVELLERPALREARAALSRSPDDRALQLRAAEHLLDEGLWAEAEALLAPLSAGSDGYAWEAARDRLALWERARALDDLKLDEAETTDWIAPFLATGLSDGAIHRPALSWLARRGACAEGQGHLAWLRGRIMLEELDAEAAAEQQARVEAWAAPLLAACPPVDAPPAAP